MESSVAALKAPTRSCRPNWRDAEQFWLNLASQMEAGVNNKLASVQAASFSIG
jgi:hypothetical protein